MVEPFLHDRIDDLSDISFLDSGGLGQNAETGREQKANGEQEKPRHPRETKTPHFANPFYEIMAASPLEDDREPRKQGCSDKVERRRLLGRDSGAKRHTTQVTDSTASGAIFTFLSLNEFIGIGKCK
ncbi:hypothetical protein [Methylosinus sp. LW4]|uniref:hypothetical protein n=1 Tax=Methylosinus sp. LW4 TaxID=136993 RepID=UPI0012FC4ABF|nr:hypothetical protein [Methylosinus sp. LW4]